ncbi:hypothetical protein ACFQH9_22790 [Pseudonocardia lutea]|jgi:hypothetical protein|uniref:Uncharacterized protein n=1 Tax=Pseudonocardia lutea TaxID=2172015 RepID=A0ABW1IBT7_9PSEU
MTAAAPVVSAADASGRARWHALALTDPIARLVGFARESTPLLPEHGS